MSAQPALACFDIFAEIINDLNTLTKDSQVNELARARELHRLEAKALDMEGPGSAAVRYSALGSISAARGNAAESRKFHKLSLACGDDNPVLYTNFAASLDFLGFSDEARDIALGVYEEYPTFLPALDVLTKAAYNAGDEAAFLRFSSEYEAEAKGPHHLHQCYLDEIEESAELSEQCTAISATSIHNLYAQ